VLLRDTFPWARLRQAQKLLRLAERHGPDRINAACARARSRSSCWTSGASGHSACRAGHRVRCVAVTKLLQALHQSRADHSFERELRRKLTAQQSSDFYDVLVERHRRAATIITSNRGPACPLQKGLAQTTLMP
jgi:hypothetical protein